MQHVFLSFYYLLGHHAKYQNFAWWQPSNDPQQSQVELQVLYEAEPSVTIEKSV